MTQIIAMYDAANLRKADLPEELNLLTVAVLTSYEDEEAEGGRYYGVECHFRRGITCHYWDGRASTSSISAAMQIFNDMVAVIKANEIYATNRNQRAESVVFF